MINLDSLMHVYFNSYYNYINVYYSVNLYYSFDMIKIGLLILITAIFATITFAWPKDSGNEDSM